MSPLANMGKEKRVKMDNETIYTKVNDKTIKDEKKLPELWPG